MFGREERRRKENNEWKGREKKEKKNSYLVDENGKGKIWCVAHKLYLSKMERNWKRKKNYLFTNLETN